jgi:hypothetical protein
MPLQGGMDMGEDTSGVRRHAAPMGWYTHRAATARAYRSKPGCYAMYDARPPSSHSPRHTGCGRRPSREGAASPSKIAGAFFAAVRLPGGWFTQRMP